MLCRPDLLILSGELSFPDLLGYVLCRIDRQDGAYSFGDRSSSLYAPNSRYDIIPRGSEEIPVLPFFDLSLSNLLYHYKYYLFIAAQFDVDTDPD